MHLEKRPSEISILDNHNFIQEIGFHSWIKSSSAILIFSTASAAVTMV